MNLTEIGKQISGQARNTRKFGEYVIWPENISLNNEENSKPPSQSLSSTLINKHFLVSAQRINLFLFILH